MVRWKGRRRRGTTEPRPNRIKVLLAQTRSDRASVQVWGRWVRLGPGAFFLGHYRPYFHGSTGDSLPLRSDGARDVSPDQKELKTPGRTRKFPRAR